MFLDYGADQANRRQQIFLRDWQQKLDDFLRFNEREALPHAGHVSRDEADRKAAAEYEQFAARRREVAEAKGEDEAMRALEKSAKSLARRKSGRGSGK